jgi:hypothetical protein
VSNDIKLHTNFFLLHLFSNDIKLHTSFQTKLNQIGNCTRIFFTPCKGVSMIRVDFGPISETVYIDIILNTIIER